MKKLTLILAAAALLAVSCAKTEEVRTSADQRGIGFSAYTAKPTRAAQTNVTTTNLNSFKVSAIGNGALYFDNVTFTRTGSEPWKSSPLYFWPKYKLSFYAYNTPAATTGFTRNISTDGQTLFVTPALALANQEDLVAAYAEDKTEEETTALTFNHYLTQVIVMAQCSNSLYQVVVDGVKVANLAGDGTYTFDGNTMTATEANINSDSSVDYSASFTAKTLTAAAQEVMTDGDNGKWYLVPQDVTAWDTANLKNTAYGTYLALKVKITGNSGALKIYPASGEESAWMAVPVHAALKFEQGRKYKVIIDFFSSTGNGAGRVDPEVPGNLDNDNETADNGKPIIGGPIQFNATVNPWEDETEIIIHL